MHILVVKNIKMQHYDNVTHLILLKSQLLQPEICCYMDKTVLFSVKKQLDEAKFSIQACSNSDCSSPRESAASNFTNETQCLM